MAAPNQVVDQVDAAADTDAPTATDAFPEAESSSDSDEPVQVPIRTLGDGEASRFVIDFYSLADLELDPEQLKRDKIIVREIWQEGYSEADLDYAIRWTIKNIPGAKRFNMVKLSIGEAFEHKWKT